MKKTTFTLKNLLGLCLFFSLSLLVLGQDQTTITGQVKDSKDKSPLVGVNILIKGTFAGTVTDGDGNFELKANAVPPFNIVFSTMGYESREAVVMEAGQEMEVLLQTKTMLTKDVVVSASRVEERLLESPVSIQKLDALAIRTTPSAEFYDGLENLKGVQLNTNSLTFKSVNARGFATFANVRFVQLIDGMDNAAPGLNFPAGNLMGISELDISNMELVPGAASALYGPNAFNGILFMNSKNPFYSQGLSAFVKGGLTMQDAAGTNPYISVGVRYAKALLNNKLAFKFNISALRGTEWLSTDYNDMDTNPLNASVRGVNSPSYDGVNMYGDEIATTLNLDALAGLEPGTLGNIRVARTGYQERDLLSDEASSYKFDAALHYRLTDRLEAIYNYRVGIGNSIYQGANRYSLNNIRLQQHKLELRADNFFIRTYTTLENAGDSYDTRFAAWNINRSWKSDTDWFTQYAQTYLGGLLGLLPDTPALSPEQAHTLSRSIADGGRLLPGTSEFATELERISNLADLRSGSKFIDKTKLFHTEGNYNFKNQFDVVDLQVGGNFRRYVLNSEGTIFTDSDGAIGINEFGIYTQVAKKLLKDRLKLTTSIRYDKNQNFDGQFTPRASAVYSAGANRQHNFRASFQTGFRNPDTQSQFIGLDLGVATLVGGAEENINDYTLEVPYFDGNGEPQVAVVQGNDIYNNSYTASSATTFAGTLNPSDLKKVDVAFVKPEQIRTFEVGYKGIIGQKLFLDVNWYHNRYQDFQANTNAVHPLTGSVDDGSAIADLANGRTRVFQLYSNSTGIVSSWGTGLGLNYALPKGFTLGGNYTYAVLDIDEDADPDLIPGFNTPEHRFNVAFGNRELINNLGFQLNFRWSDSYVWQATFGNGPIDSFTSLDALVTYKVPKLKSMLKIGGSNILNKEYRQAFGSAPVGAMYYVGWVFDELSN